MDQSSLTDDYLDELRTEPKRRVSMTRVKIKGKSNEQQFECVADGSPDRRYRVFTRQNLLIPSAFSVGLCLIEFGGDLALCRYNGGYHPHRNILEREKVRARPHIHLATERYLRAGLDSDGFAIETDRFSTMREALRCLVSDCCIAGILDPDEEPDPHTYPLFK